MKCTRHKSVDELAQYLDILLLVIIGSNASDVLLLLLPNQTERKHIQVGCLIHSRVDKHLPKTTKHVSKNVETNRALIKDEDMQDGCVGISLGSFRRDLKGMGQAVGIKIFFSFYRLAQSSLSSRTT